MTLKENSSSRRLGSMPEVDGSGPDDPLKPYFRDLDETFRERMFPRLYSMFLTPELVFTLVPEGLHYITVERSYPGAEEIRLCTGDRRWLDYETLQEADVDIEGLSTSNRGLFGGNLTLSDVDIARRIQYQADINGAGVDDVQYWQFLTQEEVDNVNCVWPGEGEIVERQWRVLARLLNSKQNVLVGDLDEIGVSPLDRDLEEVRRAFDLGVHGSLMMAIWLFYSGFLDKKVTRRTFLRMAGTGLLAGGGALAVTQIDELTRRVELIDRGDIGSNPAALAYAAGLDHIERMLVGAFDSEETEIMMWMTEEMRLLKVLRSMQIGRQKLQQTGFDGFALCAVGAENLQIRRLAAMDIQGQDRLLTVGANELIKFIGEKFNDMQALEDFLQFALRGFGVPAVWGSDANRIQNASCRIADLPSSMSILVRQMDEEIQSLDTENWPDEGDDNEYLRWAWLNTVRTHLLNKLDEWKKRVEDLEGVVLDDVSRQQTQR